ncbi:MAG: AAA family ATPase [Caldilineaceae bacterium]|nr:AAA family ATPase [Caldilineaceae bacterium]
MPFFLSLFGHWRLIHTDNTGSRDIPLARRKEQALLAYVAAQPQRTHNRESLRSLFWPDAPPDSVANNLRVSLYRLRAALAQDEDAAEPLLHISRQQIRFNSTRHGCDVARFDELVRAAQGHRHPEGPLNAECARLLAEAVGLYTGPLLDGFFIEDAGAFDEWLSTSREHYRLQVLDTAHRLADYHLAQGDLAQAGHFAQRQIAIEPLAESAYAQWMQVQVADGDRAGALQTYARCRQTLQRELGVEPGAEISRLYTTLLAEARGPAPGPVVQSTPSVTPPLPLPRPNLPHPITPLIGRAAEIDILTRRLTEASYRLFTIAGPGGIGKTRLALAVAQQVQGRYRNGLFFVPLAALQEAAHIPQAILTGLGIPPQAQGGSVQEQMLAALGGRHLLLLLDNFEHLLEGVELLLEILRTAPGVTLLVTSRVALQTQAEDRFALRGLALPGADGANPEESPAVALFVERAYRLDKSFRLDDDNRADVIALCRLLEGIPLSIELAASWTESHSCAEIRAALAHGLDFLTTEMRDLPARQRSLRAIFDYSWQLLTAEEQAGLARLAIFRGGFDPGAAAAVAGAGEPLLRRLERHYLLRSDGDGRYAMHELLRFFAAEKLALSDQTGRRVARQHSQWYLARIGSAREALLGPHSSQLSTTLYRDLDNLRLAWQTALEEGAMDKLQAALPGLSTFYELRGLYEEMIGLCGAAIARIDAQPSDAQPVDVRSSDGKEKLWLRLRVHLQVAQANALGYRGLHSQARALAEEAIPQARAIGDSGAIVQATVICGRAESEDEDMEATIARMRRVLPLLGPEQDPSLVAEFRLLLGICYSFINRHPEAAEQYTAAEAALERTQNLALRGHLLLYRAIDAAMQMDVWRSRQFVQEVLAIGAQTDNNFLRVRGLNMMGFSEAQLGNYAAAVTYHLEALALSRQMGDPQIENYALHNLCINYTYLGNLPEARRMGEAALEVGQRNRLQSGISFAQLHLGHVLLEMGELAEGKEMLGLARDGMQGLGRPALAAEAAAGVTWACYRLGDLSGALDAAEAVLDFLAENSVQGCDEPARALWQMYQTLCGAGHPQAAHILSLAHCWIQTVGDKIPDGPARHTFYTNNPFISSLVAAQTPLAR